MHFKELHPTIKCHAYNCHKCKFQHEEIKCLKLHVKNTTSHQSRKKIEQDEAYFHPLRCNYCGEGFYFNEHKAFHEKYKHNQDIEVNECKICHEKFYTRSAFFVHIGWHFAENQFAKFYICDNCPWACFNPSDLVKHHVRLHAQYRLPFHACEECKYHTESLPSMEDHMITKHQISGYKPYICQECDFEAQDFQEFIKHLNVTRHNLKNVCQYCKERFTSEKLRINHERREHIRNKACPECHIEFSGRQAVEVHLDLRHPGHKKNEFKCDMCNREYMFLASQKYCIYQHNFKAKKKDARVSKQKEAYDKLNDDGRYQCHYCQATFSPSALIRLTYHEYREHGFNRFDKLCEKCNTPYQRMHKCYTQRKPRKRKSQKFPCSECGKVYAKKEDMKIHILSVHKNERPFKCEKCDKSFSANKTLGDHQRQAHDRQICKYCDRSLQNVLYLRRHMVFDHDVKEGAIFCDKCPKKVFFSDIMFKSHLKKFHPESND